MDAFISFIALWPLNWAPRNWAHCWGANIPISENAALYSLIGSVYGGDDRTYFQLPDFRGRVPVGYGQGSGLSYYSLGMRYGFEKIRLDQSELPTHSHAAFLSSFNVKLLASSAAGTESVPGTNGATTFGATKEGFNEGNLLYNASDPDVKMSGIALTGGNVVVQNTGQSGYHENRQPYLVTNYIMCMEGIFPPRQ